MSISKASLVADTLLECWYKNDSNRQLLLYSFNVLLRTTGVSRYQMDKPFWILLKQRWWGGGGISCTICKSFAPRSRQIITPAAHHSVFRARCTSCHPTNSIKALKVWYSNKQMMWRNPVNIASADRWWRLTILGILSMSMTLLQRCLSMTCCSPPSDSTACHRVAKSVSRPLTYSAAEHQRSPSQD